MGVVWLVQYAPGEPDGVYTLCICATKDRAERERGWYITESGYDPDHILVKEEDVLE